MKGLQKFIHTHKKGCIIGGSVFLGILIIFFTVFFIAPAFGNNNYGNRLSGTDDHKITDSVVKEIKDSTGSKEGVKKVTYHQEGRILNFTIVTEGLDLAATKEYANIISEKISKKNLKYYDIQVFLTSNNKTEGFPTAGYRHKSATEFSWGNVGEKSE